MQQAKGFTLVEVLIAMVIVGILTTVALPSYMEYTRRGKIAEATSALLAMRTRLEQYYQDRRTFDGACMPGTVAPLPTGLRYFAVTCDPLPSLTQYRVVATGINDMAGIVFTIDEANVRATAVTAGSTMATAGYADNATCWVQKKGGVC